MGDEMQLANMTPRGRLVAEVFDCRSEPAEGDLEDLPPPLRSRGSELPSVILARLRRDER